MSFRVRLLQRAVQDHDAILAYIAQRSNVGAVAWSAAFESMLHRLEEYGDSFSLADENEHVEFEVRETLFKTRRGLVYRALFTIEANDILILQLRGPGQDFLSADEIGRDA